MRLLLAVSLSAGVLHAYTPWTTSAGIPLHRTDAASVQYLVNQSTAAGMKNADGDVIITPDSDPMKALQSAAIAWSSVSTAAVSFLPLQTTSAVNDRADNQHVIVFLDTPDARSVVGSALAVTVASFLSDGSIVDADILFNPTVPFSTTLAADTYDLQSVATHEMGHALGANHSGVLSATMFYGMQAQVNSPSVLSADDAAFITSAYPGPGSTDSYGVISGAVSLTNGQPVLGAFLVAADPVTGVTVGGFSSLTDGTYSFKVPRGSYLLYAEPLNAEVLPGNLYLTNAQNGQVNTSFQTTFATQLVDVTTGQASVNIAVADGAAPFSLLASGTGRALGSGDFEISGGPTLLTAGQSVDLLLYGPGLDSLGAQYEVRLLGPGLTIRPNSVHIDTNTSVNGSRLLRMTVDVALQTSPTVASVIVVKNSVAAALSGGLLILPAQ
jgi:Matrixin